MQPNKIGVQLFMLSGRLLANDGLSVAKLGKSKVILRFSTAQESEFLTPTLFMGQL